MPFRIIIIEGPEIHLYKVLEINNKNFYPDTKVHHLGMITGEACIMKR